MRLLLLPLLALLCLHTSGLAQESSQPTSVEKSQWGIQLGLLELNVYNEAKLSESVVLRSELSARASYNSLNGIGISPTLTVSPRWYYNLKKRAAKDKVTAHNSANFLALELSHYFYHENFQDFSFEENQYSSVMAKWGIRRSINDHFHYEIGLGLGALMYHNDLKPKRLEFTQDIDLRFGYKF